MRTLFALHRAANGWIVGDSQYISTSDVPQLRVFRSMRELAGYLIAASEEKEPKQKSTPCHKKPKQK